MDEKSTIKAEMLELGFQEIYIDQALQITTNREQIVELIFSFQEEEQKSNANKNIQIQNNNMQIDQNSVYQMIFLIRGDLKMGVGKIAAQTGHARNYQNLKESQHGKQLLNIWKQKGSQKTAYKVNSKEQMLEIYQKAENQNVFTYIVQDAGKTQIEPGSLTVCAIGPIKQESINALVGQLSQF